MPDGKPGAPWNFPLVERYPDGVNPYAIWLSTRRLVAA